MRCQQFDSIISWSVNVRNVTDASLTQHLARIKIDLQRFVSVLHRLLFDDLILAELKWFLQSQVCHTGDHFLLADHEVGVGTTDWVSVTIINY